MNAVGVAIWTAWASAGTTAQTVTATRANDVSADAVLAVYSLAGASQSVGATGGYNGFGSSSEPLSIGQDPSSTYPYDVTAGVEILAQ